MLAFSAKEALLTFNFVTTLSATCFEQRLVVRRPVSHLPTDDLVILHFLLPLEDVSVDCEARVRCSPPSLAEIPARSTGRFLTGSSRHTHEG